MSPLSRRWIKALTRAQPHLLVAIALALCLAAAYLPGLSGPFVFDDFENIVDNPPVALHSLSPAPFIDALLANDSGPFGRPLASISFALNYYFAGGFEPVWFKLTNLAIHVVNAWLVYALVLAIATTPRLSRTWPEPRRRVIAGLVAAAWALHPIQLTSVLYVVQRMTSLAAAFVLAGALLYLYGRARLARGQPHAWLIMALALGGGVLLGVAAKETAALLPLYAIVIEYALFRQEKLKPPQKRSLALFYGLVFVVPVALFLLFLLLHPAFITDGYAARDYTVWQRLLTEARVLWTYVALIVFPAPSRFSLFHDDIGISNNFYDPVSTVFAVAAVIAAAAFALHHPQRQAALKFGILWFLAGHALESSIFGLDLAHEHRNYVPSIGLIFALIFGLTQLIERVNWRFATLALSAGALVATLGFTTWVRAGEWSDTVTLAYTTAHYHPASPRANDFAARVSLREKNDPVAAIRYTLRGLALRPREPGFHIDLQVLLAILSQDLEQQLRASTVPQKTRAPVPVEIAGLDPGLELTYVGARARLQHPASDFATVERLLQQSVISVHTVISLESLRRCVLEPPEPCSSVHDAALHWHLVAAGNPHTSAMYRGLILMGSARLAASRGQTRAALDYMNRAVELVPGQLAFRLGTLGYTIDLGQMEAAAALVQTIRAGTWPRADWAANQAALERLERRVAERGAAEPRPVAVPR